MGLARKSGYGPLASVMLAGYNLTTRGGAGNGGKIRAEGRNITGSVAGAGDCLPDHSGRAIAPDNDVGGGEVEVRVGSASAAW